MDYVRLHARLHPERQVVTDLGSGRAWNYTSFDRYIAACTALLLQSNIRSGDRIACLSKNRAEVIVLHLACARIGAIFVPLNWRLSDAELRQLIDDCEPKILFADSQEHDLGATVVALDSLEAQCAKLEPVWPHQPSVDLPSLMLYTSGTTGKPKGVLLSERNLTETAINFTLLGEVNALSGFLCESPMFHIIGMVTSVRPALFCGARIVISDAFEPQRTLARLADPQLGISHYFCVPQMALALRAEKTFSADQLRNMKAIFTGGAPHPAPQILAWLEDGIPIVDGYGMSEAGTVFGMPLDTAMIRDKAGCVGLPTPRIQARIVDEAGEVAPVNVPGELQLKGDNITCGYWRREEDFAQTLTEDGWFRTGDILVVDEGGFFRVTDRKKDMYISGGENVYPAEVEAQLLDFPGIGEFTVVGVPDQKWGEVGCLFYVAESDTISVEAIEEFLSPRLARYKIPKQARAIPAIPRNGVGKILKHQLRASQ